MTTRLLCTAACALLCAAAAGPAAAQTRVVAASASPMAFAAVPAPSADAPTRAGIPLVGDPRVSAARIAHGIAPAHALVRAQLLAPAVVAPGRRACIEDALALLRPGDPGAPPSWLSELRPVFEARAAVSNATRLDGDGYGFRLSPLKLRGAFHVRLGSSLDALLGRRADGDGAP